MDYDISEELSLESLKRENEKLQEKVNISFRNVKIE